MTVLKKVYYQIIDCPAVPPETGGILGTCSGVIDYFCFDAGIPDYDRAVYTPNINALNYRILRWSKKGIRFCGMFHSHPKNQPGLSSHDVHYIEQIMRKLYPALSSLYFPIVLPNEKMLSYRAFCRNDVVFIEEDKIHII